MSRAQASVQLSQLWTPCCQRCDAYIGHVRVVSDVHSLQLQRRTARQLCVQSGSGVEVRGLGVGGQAYIRVQRASTATA